MPEPEVLSVGYREPTGPYVSSAAGVRTIGVSELPVPVPNAWVGNMETVESTAPGSPSPSLSLSPAVAAAAAARRSVAFFDLPRDDRPPTLEPPRDELPVGADGARTYRTTDGCGEPPSLLPASLPAVPVLSTISRRLPSAPFLCLTAPLCPAGSAAPPANVAFVSKCRPPSTPPPSRSLSLSLPLSMSPRHSRRIHCICSPCSPNSSTSDRCHE